MRFTTRRPVLLQDRSTGCTPGHHAVKKQKTIRPAEKQSQSTGEAPSARRLADLFARCGVALTPPQQDMLWTYHQMLRRANADLNLTRIHNFESMVLKLYVDSVLPATLTDLPSPLMDLGSGPGMPGVPLKIFRPDIDIHLAETRDVRNRFLQSVADALGLPGLSVVGRGIAPDYETPTAGVITRAVATMADTMDRVSGCLARDGRIVFMKGPDCDAEIADALQRVDDAYELLQDTRYSIPTTDNRRRLVVFRRVGDPAPVRRAAADRRHRAVDIDSTDNRRFKQWKGLLTGRGIKKSGQALFSGARIISDALRRHPDACRTWISAGDNHPPPETAPATLDWARLSAPLFKHLDSFGTGHPLLVVDPPRMPAWDPEEGFSPGCSLLIPFQDPENVGAAIRSAVAFGAATVILLAESAHPFHPRAIRASAGAVLSAPLRQGPALADLPPGLPILGLSGDGRPLDGIRFPAAFGLLPGLEGPGLPATWRGDAVAVPITDGVESLNAATALAIVLYAWSRRCPDASTAG
jgi:16S rRNA (guanine(527)-N(7))-methyltransferase RsmG